MTMTRSSVKVGTSIRSWAVASELALSGVDVDMAKRRW